MTVFFCAAVVAPAAGPCLHAATDPVTAEHRDIKDCPSEPGCPALILLDERELNNESGRTKYTSRRLIKFFTQEGIEKYGQIDTYAVIGGNDVRNMKGRTILPDGNEVRLTLDDIHLKWLKRGKRRIKVKSATFPGIVPGAIVEYSYDFVTEPNSYMTDTQWDIQQDLPILESRFILKQGKYQMGWSQGGSEPVKVEHASPFKNVNNFVARNVPSIPDEPFGPVDGTLQARIQFGLPEVAKVWVGSLAGRYAGFLSTYLEGEGIEAKAKELVGAETSPTIKLRKIYDFLQEKVGAPEADDEEEEKPTKNAGEDLARGHGNEFERTMLFMALAKAAGIETGLLLIASRGNGKLRFDFNDGSQFDAYAVAAKTGQGWTFYDPAIRHLTFGMISPEKEGAPENAIMVHSSKDAGKLKFGMAQNLRFSYYMPVPYAIVGIPFSAAAKNVLKREARVTIGDDGTGTVEVVRQGSGHVDLEHRRAYEPLTDEERREALVERVRDEIPSAELVSSEFLDIDAFGKEARVKYTMSVPKLATIVGNRMIISPSVLESSAANPFTAETRRTPVNFPYASRTQDKVVIVVPEGYEAGELPGPVAVRDEPFVLTVSYAQAADQIVMNRRLDVDAAVWPVEDYARLKAFSEKVHESNRVAITLIRKAAE